MNRLTPELRPVPASHLHESVDRHDLTAVIRQRRRGEGKSEVARVRVSTDVVLNHRAIKGRALGQEVGDEVSERGRIKHGAGQACAPASRPFSSTAMVSGSPPRALLELCRDGSRQTAGRAAADYQDVELENLAWRARMTRLLQRRDQCGHDLEQIADDAVVGDLEDRGIGILVDRHNRFRALHADDVLDRAGNAERNIELRRDRLSGTANLTIHGQPAHVANRAGRRQLGAQGRGELPRQVDVSGSWIPRPTETMRPACVRSTVCLASGTEVPGVAGHRLMRSWRRASAPPLVPATGAAHRRETRQSAP